MISHHHWRAQKLLESMDEFGDTPIIKACRRGHTDVASYLLDQGANIDARNEDGYTPLMLACYWEQLEVVDLLLRHGADAGLTSNNGVFFLPPAELTRSTLSDCLDLQAERATTRLVRPRCGHCSLVVRHHPATRPTQRGNLHRCRMQTCARRL